MNSFLIEDKSEKKAIYQVIHRDIEPGVINDAMLQGLIVEQGHRGVAGGLARLNSIDYSLVTSITVEFQNVLKIDHLWVMPNLRKLSLQFNKIERIENIDMLTQLTELDLAYNCLERIEGLETLVNLEVLSLFGNKIKQLEGLDTLSKMLIMSVGNNEIDTFDGIDRLRFMKELRSLNLEGNPIAERPAKNTTFRVYVAAFLPHLKYYNYEYIYDDERENGINEFSLELAQLEEAQLNEVKERERIARELADEQRLSCSFVELLNEHQLFDSFWTEDTDGAILMLIGEEVLALKEELRNEVFHLTQQIYKLGLVKHEQRMKEIAMYEQCVNEAKLKAQKAGIELINHFLAQRDETFEATKAIYRILDEESTPLNEAELENLEAELQKRREDFYECMIDKTWQTAMEAEAQTYESIEDANTQFGHSITEMLNEFIEQAQGFFVQMRDAEGNFSDSVYETASRFIQEQAAAGNNFAIPEELLECLEDKDAIVNFIAGSRDVHMQVIDAREDRLVTRARQWANELVNNLQSNELQRNRNKVMEISYFLDKQREAFDRIQEEVENENED